MPIHNVADATREFKAGTSKHLQSRKQAIAVGLSYERKGKRATRRQSSRRMTGR